GFRSEAGFTDCITIKPSIVEELDYVKASIDLSTGLLKNEWEKNGDKVVFHLDIPWNTKAYFHIPEYCELIEEGGTYTEITEKKRKILLTSGKYKISCRVK